MASTDYMYEPKYLSMTKLLTVLLSLLFCCQLSANNLQITQLSTNGSTLTFQVTWDNSWRNGLTYHDAVWVFVKQLPNGGPNWEHANVAAAQVDQGYQSIVSTDKVGVFIRRASNGIGTATSQVQLVIDNPLGVYQDYKVMGTEMVYVPQGQFYAGDGASTARVHQGSDVNLPMPITSDGAIVCGNGSNNIGTVGGACYDIPAAYPTGYNAFYSMKYVITQQQYVDFLNTMTRAQQEERVNANIAGTHPTNIYVMANAPIQQNRNAVRCPANIGTGKVEFFVDANGNGIAGDSDDGQGRACATLSNDHWMAYLDWSGLRPYSFLEIEKASRGPAYPVANEFSWGTPNRSSAGTVINVGTDSEKYTNSNTDGGIHHAFQIRVGANAPSTSATRELSGASFYGIIDIGNHPSDLYIGPAASNPYQGTHGDGRLSIDGFATNADWISHTDAHSKWFHGISHLYQLYSSGSGRGVRSI